MAAQAVYNEPFLRLDEDTQPLLTLAKHETLIQRYQPAVESPEWREFEAQIIRGEVGDPTEAIKRLMNEVSITRGILSTNTAFPKRENLDGEVHILTPVETPLRNMIPRVPGSGSASAWKQQTTLGVGFGYLTTTVGNLNTANTFLVANANGFQAGEYIIVNATTTHQIVSIDYPNKIITVGASPGIGLNAQVGGQTVVKSSLAYPESDVASQYFYKEDGGVTESSTVWADKSAAYKLHGTKGSVSMFAMAVGRSFMDQYANEKSNTLKRMLMKEEYALLFSNTSSILAPWGDGAVALGYLGLIPFIDANAPANQIQSAVGALTLKHCQDQLTRIWNNGGKDMFMLINGVEATSFMRLAEASGNYRLVLESTDAIKLGGRVATLIHVASGEAVPIIVHRMMPAGTIVFGAKTNFYGQPFAQVSVLPQVDMPESAFQDNAPFGGYFAQDLAPAEATPELLKFIVKCYSVPEWRNAQILGISRGITPVS